MGPRLPILTVAGLMGAGLVIWMTLAQVKPSPRPENGPHAAQKRQTGDSLPSSVGGQAILEHAILTLESRHSVSAKIRHSVDLFGKEPVGSGMYLEQRSEQGLLFRFSLRLQTGDQPSNLLQVCDGRNLWMYRELGGGETLSRIDVVRVEQALEDSGELNSLWDIGYWPGLGGLPKLLRGLHATFDFTPVAETRLAGQRPVGVWKLRGEWKPEKLARILPEEEEAIKEGKQVNLGKLPDHLPDHVLLFLGKEDEFPYRIEYRRRETDPPRDSEDLQDRAVVTMELFEVSLNAPIHPARFVYSPGDLECADKTADFLKSLGLAP